MAVTSRLRRPRTSSGFDRRLIAPMVLGSILNPVNSSIIAISLIPIGRDLHATPAETAWLVSALYVATSIGQPVVGRLVDLFGPRRLYLIGTAMVGLAGVLGLLAPTLGWLVVSRVILGFGTCAGYPASMALIRREADRTGEQSPAGILTILAVANQTIAVIGPTLGGLLIGIGGWRSTFAVNIPLSLACLALGVRRLPRTTAATSPSDHGADDAGNASVPQGISRFDLPGIVLFAGALVALLLFAMSPRLSLIWLLVLALALGAAFVRVEHRAAAPFVDLHVLRGNWPLVLTYVRGLLVAVVSYTVLYGFTQWLEVGRRLDPSQAGLILLPVFAVAILVSTLTGRRAAVRGKLVVGAVTQLAAGLLMLLLGPGSAIWLLLVVVVVLGIPQGLLNLAVQNAVYFQADPDRVASSSGLLRTFMYVGAIVASVTSGAVLARSPAGGIRALGAVVAAVAALLLILSLLDRGLAAVGRVDDATPSP